MIIDALMWKLGWVRAEVVARINDDLQRSRAERAIEAEAEAEEEETERRATDGGKEMIYRLGAGEPG